MSIYILNVSNTPLHQSHFVEMIKVVTIITESLILFPGKLSCASFFYLYLSKIQQGVSILLTHPVFGKLQYQLRVSNENINILKHCLQKSITSSSQYQLKIYIIGRFSDYVAGCRNNFTVVQIYKQLLQARWRLYRPGIHG